MAVGTADLLDTAATLDQTPEITASSALRSLSSALAKYDPAGS